MSKLNVNAIEPSTGTDITLGASGDTTTVPSGATIVNSGTATGFGATLTGSTNNQVTTVTAANAIQGETHLTYDGTILGCGALGSGADLGVGLHIKTADSGASAMTAADELIIENSANSGLTILSGTSHIGGIYLGDSGDTDIGKVEYDHSDNSMRFTTNAGESVRILSSSDLLVNTASRTAALSGNAPTGFQYFVGNSETSDNAYASAFIKHTSAKMHGLVIRDEHSNGNQIEFLNSSGTQVGLVSQDGSNTTYGTSSDYRLKENETLITDGIDRVKQLKPYRLNYKKHPDKTIDAFFAHEVSSIVPEAVIGEKDGMMVKKDGVTPILDEDENNPQQRIEVQQLEHSKLVPLLTSALQEAITKIETLETKVTALENA